MTGIIIYSLLGVAIVIGAVVTLSITGRKTQKLEAEALSLTPAVDVSGHWTIYTSIGAQPLVGSARLSQSGANITGTMQFKLAALHPLHISGVLHGSELLATYCRPHHDGIGSGILDLSRADNGRSFKGVATWFDDRMSDEERFEHHWVQNESLPDTSGRHTHAS